MSIEEKEWYKVLRGKISENILLLKNYDEEYYFDNIDNKSLNYFFKKAVDTPWQNHLALTLMCVCDRGLSPASTYNLLSPFNARLQEIFLDCGLNDMSEFNYGIVEKYLLGEINKGHIERQRTMFLTAYNSFQFNMSK